MKDPRQEHACTSLAWVCPRLPTRIYKAGSHAGSCLAWVCSQMPTRIYSEGAQAGSYCLHMPSRIYIEEALYLKKMALKRIGALIVAPLAGCELRCLERLLWTYFLLKAARNILFSPLKRRFQSTSTYSVPIIFLQSGFKQRIGTPVFKCSL